MIRPARESDIQQIKFLAQTCFAPFVSRMGRKIKMREFDYGKDVRDGKVTVYMVDNSVRGFITTRRDGMDLHIENMAVTAKFRRQGVGRALLDHADQQGIRNKCLRLILHSSVIAFENIAYYRGRGFTEIDRRFAEGQEMVLFERYLR